MIVVELLLMEWQRIDQPKINANLFPELLLRNIAITGCARLPFSSIDLPCVARLLLAKNDPQATIDETPILLWFCA